MTVPTPGSDAAGPPAGERSPLASVVIICYNHGRYLGEAIESVLAQTLQGVECVVVDDGSTDDTPAVAARYPSVRYVRQENQGMSAARNTGFRASAGRYVSFLDADDRLLPDALLAGTECFRRNPECGYVSGHFRMIAADGTPLPSEIRPCILKDHYRVLLEQNYIGMHATVLFRRDALDQVGGFDRRLRACDDYEIYLRMARVLPASCHDRVVAEYRWHGANTSHNMRLMIRSTMGPHRAQWKYVRGHPELEASYRAGVREWQRYFGKPLLVQTLVALRHPGQWGAAVLGIATLLRFYPRGLWERLVKKMARIFGRQGPGAPRS